MYMVSEVEDVSSLRTKESSDYLSWPSRVDLTFDHRTDVSTYVQCPVRRVHLKHVIHLILYKTNNGLQLQLTMAYNYNYKGVCTLVKCWTQRLPHLCFRTVSSHSHFDEKHPDELNISIPTSIGVEFKLLAKTKAVEIFLLVSFVGIFQLHNRVDIVTKSLLCNKTDKFSPVGQICAQAKGSTHNMTQKHILLQ